MFELELKRNDCRMNKTSSFACRKFCGACCIAPSIHSPLPGMPNGKPAGIPCIHLDADTMACRIFNDPERPAFCGSLQPSPEMCGNCRMDALRYLTELEQLTAPDLPED